MLSWLSCERYTHSASRSLDQELGLWERMRYAFHHFICISCRRFSRQMNAIENYCGSPEGLEQLVDAASEEQGIALSIEESNRIKRSLEQHGLAK